MDRQEENIGLVVDGKLLWSGAARALNMTPVAFAKLLNSRGILLLKPTADEIQRELESAAFRARIMLAEK